MIWKENWNAQKSQVYRELTALENAGYIQGTWIEQDAYKSMFWGFTISYGRRRSKMVVEWCDECLSQLEGIKNAKRS